MMASLQQPSAPAPTGSAPRAGGPALLFGVGLLLTAGLVGAVVVLVTWPPVPLPLLIVCAALGLSLGPWGPVALVAGVVLRRNRRILATGSVAVGTGGAAGSSAVPGTGGADAPATGGVPDMMDPDEGPPAAPEGQLPNEPRPEGPGLISPTLEFRHHNQPSVINGTSDLLNEVFGEKGRHARSAVGVK